MKKDAQVSKLYKSDCIDATSSKKIFHICILLLLTYAFFTIALPYLLVLLGFDKFLIENGFISVLKNLPYLLNLPFLLFAISTYIYLYVQTKCILPIYKIILFYLPTLAIVVVFFTVFYPVINENYSDIIQQNFSKQIIIDSIFASNIILIPITLPLIIINIINKIQGKTNTSILAIIFSLFLLVVIAWSIYQAMHMHARL